MAKEMWKKIDECPKYQVSTFGNIRKIGNDFNAPITINSYGRCVKTLTVNGKSKTFQVHRLVGKAFIPNPQNKPEINHKDLNPKNNHISNLEWVTTSENISHFIRARAERNKIVTPKEHVKNYDKKYFTFNQSMF